jgi:hypothetical protein
VSGTLVIYELGPRKAYSVDSIPNDHELRVGFDSTVGWLSSPELGRRKLSGVELADIKREAQFPGEIALRKVFRQMRLKSKVSLGGRDTYVIEAVPDEGTPWTMYFDAQTWLEV